MRRRYARHIKRWTPIAAACAAIALSACSWDSSLYEMAAKDGHVIPCPPEILKENQNGTIVKYIEIAGYKCTENNTCISLDTTKDTNSNLQNQLKDSDIDTQNPPQTSDLDICNEICPHFQGYFKNQSTPQIGVKKLFLDSSLGNYQSEEDIEIYSKLFNDGNLIICPKQYEYCDIETISPESDSEIESKANATPQFVCKTKQAITNKLQYDRGTTTCNEDQVLCNNKCINPNVENDYCGAKLDGLCNSENSDDKNYKGKTCGTGYFCNQGQCELNFCASDTDEIPCNSVCTKIKTDNKHCGGCNIDCDLLKPINTTADRCSDGICQYQCNPPYANIGQSDIASKIQCVDFNTDSQNCGSKGNICDENFVCVKGNCVRNDCPKGTILCALSEKDRDCRDINASDINNCGGCNIKCESITPTNTSVTKCSEGKCQYQCNAPYTNIGANSTANSIQCVNLSNDAQNCGEKGNVCKANEVCVDGMCEENKCKNNETLCSTTSGKTCININGSDINNCGACGYACKDIANATVTKCEKGACQYECNAPFTNIGANSTANGIQCVNYSNDSNNCGKKGNVCKAKEVCVDGRCETNACGTNETLCSTTSGKTCININGSDINNCGACGYTCKNIANATVTKCEQGACQYQCSAPYTNIGANSTANGIQCVNYSNDSNNCGKKGNVCKAKEVCVDGRCETNACGTNETLCATTAGKTCININGSDINNCGACGYACKNIANATVTKCEQGACQYECNTPYTNIGANSTANGIQCVNFSNDSNNCGKKGNVCKAKEVCVDGRCETNDCDTNETLCATTSGKTCININGNDINNCGACGYACKDIANATVTKCEKGACQYECNAPFTNIGANSTANGIQCVNYSNDSNNCGKKGNVCKAKEVCVDGRCETNACDTNETLCSTTSGKTCFNLQTNKKNCGYCGRSCSDPSNGSANCSDGECVYTCNDDYHLNDKNQCIKIGDTNCCGKECRSCNDIKNAQTTECSNEKCSVTMCITGYHPNADYTGCIANTDTECAKPDTTTTLNCTKHDNAKSGMCTMNGECYALTCETGYWANNGKCTVNSDSQCGSATNDCTNQNNKVCDTNSGTCVECTEDNHCNNQEGKVCNTNSGTCVECTEDNHCNNQEGKVCDTNSETCVECTENKHCYNQVDQATATTCSSNKCVATACNTGYYKDDGKCLSSDNENCDTKGRACAENAECTQGKCKCGTISKNKDCIAADYTCSVNYGVAKCESKT